MASYGYDLAGHTVSVSDTSAAITAPVSGAVAAMSYSYDALNHLTGTSFSPVQAQAPPTVSTAVFTFAYNAANQRIGQTATDNSFWAYPAAAPATINYTANNLNQYTAVGSVTPTYDGNGNLTFDGNFTYCYDAENRLIAAISSGTCASPTTTVGTYTHDGQGRRKSKTVSGTTTITVTDPANRALLDYDGTSGAILRWYAFGLGLNDVLSQTNVATGTRTTFVPDIQGSLVATLDSGSGALTKTGYLPFGASPGTPITFGFTGQQIDPETNGLYYFRARHYSPLLGRFMQVDPIGYAGGSNLYAYVGNDPLNKVDPLGLDCVSANGATSCSTSAYSVSFPTPAGWQDFTSTSTNYHFYNTPANVGSADPAKVQQWVVNNPKPGYPSPATQEGTLNDATPFVGGVSPVNISPVLSYTTTNQINGSPVVLNVTLPGHPLFPGVVVRETDQTSSGTVINNFGEGTSALQSPTTVEGEILGPDINGVWTGQVPPPSQVPPTPPK